MADLIHSGILFWALAILLLSGFVQGLSGFGLALLGVPLLTFFVPPPVSVPLVTLLTVSVSGLMLVQLYDHIDWPRALWLGIPTVLFAPCGVYLLKILPEAYLCFGIGFVLIGSTIYSWLKTAQAPPTPGAAAAPAIAAGAPVVGFEPGAQPTSATVPLSAVAGRHVRARLVAIGCCSGVLGGAIGMNGPLIADYLNKSGVKPSAFKVTLNLIFFVSALTRIGLYFGEGVMQERSLWLALCGTPVALGASYVGGHMTKRLRPATFAKAINAFLLLIGVWMLFQGWRKTSAPEPLNDPRAALNSKIKGE